MFLVLSGYKEKLTNITGYLLLSVQPEIFASLGVHCPDVPLWNVLPAKGGACTVGARRSRSEEKVSHCSCTQSWPFFGSKGALYILAVIFFMKKLSVHIFLLPFAWWLHETMKRWFMREVQEGYESQSSCTSSFNEVFHTRPAIIWIHYPGWRFLHCFAQ